MTKMPPTSADFSARSPLRFFSPANGFHFMSDLILDGCAIVLLGMMEVGLLR